MTTHQQRWRELGYEVEWSDEVRGYVILRRGKQIGIQETVQAVEDLIQRRNDGILDTAIGYLGRLLDEVPDSDLKHEVENWLCDVDGRQ